jgi:hypothetical protein
MPTAASLLKPSKLSNQQELIKDDVEVKHLTLFIGRVISASKILLLTRNPSAR